jgi:hypothetical protein
LRRAFLIAGGLLLLLIAGVCLRAWVPVRYYAHFDSDQAVLGLMVRDLVAGRGFPMFFYGQRYLLAVSVWLCAPLFAVFGPSIVTLKLPLFLMNIAVVCMLWVGFRREPGMDPWGTALAILPFAIPNAVVSSRLVEMQGGNIEPFVFILMAFFLRSRPIALGIVLGVSFLNREYSFSAFIALLLMDVVQGTVLRNITRYALTIACAAIVAAGLRVLAHWSNSYSGALALYRRGGWENVAPLFTQHLPALVGGKPLRLADFNIISALTVGSGIVYLALIAWVILVAGAMIRRPPVDRDELNGMSTFLVLVGAGQAVAYLGLSPYPRDIMVIRYVLVTLLAVCGLVAFAWRRPALRIPTAAAILFMTAVNLWGNVQLVREYATNPPQRDVNQLADALLQRGVRYVRAGYWTAWDVDWLTGERIIAVPPGTVARLPRYLEAIDAHTDEAFTLDDHPHPGCEALLRWYLCPPGIVDTGHREIIRP